MKTEASRIIKKYKNRRLYDMTRRRYITLNDIKKYVLDHLDFRIIDAHSKTDLTKATLLQIITEQDSGTEAFFTTELLQQMIRLYHQKMQTYFSQYFEQALQQFIQHQATWTKPIEKYQKTPLEAMNELTRLQREFWDSLIKK